MGVVVRRYIDILTINLNFPYSCIRFFGGSSILTSLFIFKMFFRSCVYSIGVTFKFVKLYNYIYINLSTCTAYIHVNIFLPQFFCGYTLFITPVATICTYPLDHSFTEYFPLLQISERQFPDIVHTCSLIIITSIYMSFTL